MAKLKSIANYTLKLVLAFLSLTCIIYFFLGGPSIFDTQIASELIPIQVVIDENQNGELNSTIFLIRQHYEFFTKELTIIPFILFSILSVIGIIFLIHSFKKWAQISWVFVTSGILLWLAIILVQNDGQPIMTLYEVVFSQLIWLGIFSLFSLTILSSNSIGLFLFEIGYSNSKKETQNKWLILIGFYAINLVFSFGHLIWNFQTQTYIPGFVFWIISISLGIFQEFQKNERVSFFSGLAFLSLSTALLMLCTSNDPGIRAIETWALISQLITLFLFPLFVIRNFNPLLKQNLPVFKVIDKPQILPTYILYLGILILGTSFVFALNGGAYHQITASKFNADGDLALILNDPFLAEINFKQGLIHSKLNAKSNTSLASIAYRENKTEELAYYLSTSQVKHPSEKIAVALSNIYQQENHLFESLFALQSAYQKMPKSSEITTQLAYTFDKLNQLDSAYYYYQKAFENDPAYLLTRANYLYSIAHLKKKLSLAEINQDTKDAAILANLWAIELSRKKQENAISLDHSFIPKADLRDLAMVYNSIFYFKDKQNLLPLHKMAMDTSILSLFPEIKLAEAMQDYFHQDPINSLEKISLYIDNQPTEKTIGLQSLLNYLHQASLIVKKSPKISSPLEARLAVKNYPFQQTIIKNAIPFLSKKEAYVATLLALRWNEEIPDFYAMYAFQALEIGEIEYAKEAMNSLKKRNEFLFQANLKTFESKLATAIKRQKF